MKKRIPFVLPMLLVLSLAACLPAMAAVLPDRTNVCSYGAVPNDSGVGGDDTAAINAALNAAMPTPTPGSSPTRSIYFPPGTYIYNSVMTLPANTSFRLYGDGPGVATILFTGLGAGGINANNMGNKSLQIEGLTLKANSGNCGTAINASFANGPKFRTATIRNVEIMGSDRSNFPAGYWGTGISLFKAQNALVEDVQIHGRFNIYPPTLPDSNIGIHWRSTADFGATQLFLKNIHIDFFKNAIKTEGWVEGFYLSGFEFVWCGGLNQVAMDLKSTSSVYPNLLPPEWHITHGHIDFVGNGIAMEALSSVKISHVNFIHEYWDGTAVRLTNSTDAMVTDCNFAAGATQSNVQNGVYSNNSSLVRFCGNTFRDFPQPVNGNCVAVDGYGVMNKVVDNMYWNVNRQFYSAPTADTFRRDY